MSETLTLLKLTVPTFYGTYVTVEEINAETIALTWENAGQIQRAYFNAAGYVALKAALEKVGQPTEQRLAAVAVASELRTELAS